MNVIPLSIEDVFLIEPKVFGDDRGFFLESYNQLIFAEMGIEDVFVQDNHSKSVKGVLRGLHFQKPPYTQGKLVRVISGEVYDVAVDMRRESITFGQYVAEVLSAENRRMLYVPPGFAHGFQVLSDNAEFLYKCTEVYHPEAEDGIRWDDAYLNIAWPIKDPALSNKDLKLPSFEDAFKF